MVFISCCGWKIVMREITLKNALCARLWQLSSESTSKIQWWVIQFLSSHKGWVTVFVSGAKKMRFSQCRPITLLRNEYSLIGAFKTTQSSQTKFTACCLQWTEMKQNFTWVRLISIQSLLKLSFVITDWSERQFFWVKHSNCWDRVWLTAVHCKLHAVNFVCGCCGSFENAGNKINV